MKILNIILAFLVLTFLVSCGKDDKNTEFVDDKTETKQEKTDNASKEHSVDSTLSTKDSIAGENKKGSNFKQDFGNEKSVANITPLEAGDYVGKTVTVNGFVADIYQSEKVAYLNFVEKYPNNPFTAVIFARQFEDFPEIEKYKNKKVEVTGRVSVFKGKPQIILNSPNQLKMK